MAVEPKTPGLPRPKTASPSLVSPSKLQLPGSSPTGSPTRTSAGSWKGLRGSMLLGGFGRSSFFAEKQAVVLCFGEAFTKVGLAGESRPRAIFRSPELRRRKTSGGEVWQSLTEEEWKQVLGDLLNRIFFQHLHLSPKDRRMVIAEGVYSSKPFRQALTSLLFQVFAVPSICFVLELVLPLYLTGLHTGLVVDLGYDSARVLPTSAGVPVISAFSDAACGTKDVLQVLERSLAVDEHLCEEVMVSACYVVCAFPADGERPARTLKTELDAEVRVVGQEKALHVPAACRHEATEIFFTPQGSTSCACETIPEAVVRSLELCPIDLRAQLVQNLVVVGGGATLRGLLPRLAQEVQKALQEQQALSALASKLRVTPLDFAPITASWVGAAIFASLEGLPDYSMDDFQKGHPLPDWLETGFV